MPVVDAATAIDAVKMSGLPLLIVGLNAFAVAWLSNHSATRVAAFVFAVLFVFIAFRLRAERTGWALIATLLSVCFFLLQVSWRSLMIYLLGFYWQGLMVEAVRLVIPTFAVVLAIGGLRGWIWLRRNGTAQRY
jgi:hypothetical protein